MINGKLTTDTPDELFDRFSEISASLPDNASTWTLQLCSSSLSALTLDLSEAVMSGKTFFILDLPTFVTNAPKLDALRIVRTQASTSYRLIVKETIKIKVLLLKITQNRGLALSNKKMMTQIVVKIIFSKALP